MPNRDNVAVIVGVASIAAVAGFALGDAMSSDATTVTEVRVAQDSVETGGGIQTAGLVALQGIVVPDQDDLDEFAIDGIDLDLGPDRWVATAPAFDDYDRDGTREPLLEELEGLLGTEATVLVRVDDEGDDATVYAINGRPYRDVGGPIPWHTGAAADEEAIRGAAADAVGPNARVVDLESINGDTVAWEAEVVDIEGREHTVVLDASGTILTTRPD